MKKNNLLIRYFFIGFLFLSGLIFALSVNAEEIGSYQVDIKINKNAGLLIKENIIYDFGSLSRHGIFRDIPVSYKTNKGTRKINVKVKKVFRDDKQEPYKTSRHSSDLRIKIGDKNKMITGVHNYEIVYEVFGAINYFDNFDELYWNAIGHDWKINISSSYVRIELPEEVVDDKLQFSCYQGKLGSQDKCQIVLNNGVLSASAKVLQPGEGLTIAVGFPKGLVDKESLFFRIWRFIKNSGILFLPILVFIVMFWLWQKKGRDPKGRKTIIPRYEPPQKMKPTMVGSLIDERVDNRDITAGLLYLAQQGFVYIKRIEKKGLFKKVDYEIKLIKDKEQIKGKTEKEIAGMFFDINKSRLLSEMKKDTYIATKMKDLKNDINEEMVLAGFFVSNPAKTRGTYITIGLMIIFISFYFHISFAFSVSLIVSGLIIFMFGFFMSKKTKQGVLTQEHLKGFKEFLTVTDKDRLKFHNAPAKDPKQFMKYLPYAVAMGVEKQWAKQFSDMYIEPPSWYGGNFSSSFTSAMLINDLSLFKTQVAKGLAVAAKGAAGSGGGGFSGGGFGGGGGGSW